MSDMRHTRRDQHRSVCQPPGHSRRGLVADVITTLVCFSSACMHTRSVKGHRPMPPGSCRVGSGGPPHGCIRRCRSGAIMMFDATPLPPCSWKQPVSVRLCCSFGPFRFLGSQRRTKAGDRVQSDQLRVLRSAWCYGSPAASAMAANCEDLLYAVVQCSACSRILSIPRRQKGKCFRRDGGVLFAHECMRWVGVSS